jgi:hypothetical protein
MPASRLARLGHAPGIFVVDVVAPFLRSEVTDPGEDDREL